MRYLSFFTLVLVICFTANTTSGQSLSWAQGFSAANSTYGLDIFCGKTDAAGNVYSVGWFTGTVDLDAGPGVYNLTATGGGNMFLLKEDAAGNFIWARHFAGLSAGVYGMYGFAIDLDEAGNIYVAGTIRDSFDVDPGPNMYPLSTNGGLGSFVIKHDSAGIFTWAKLMANTVNTAGNGINTLDMKVKAGHIYLGGHFSGTLDVDPGPGVYNVSAADIGIPDIQTPDLFIEQLDTAGNFIWVKTIGGLGAEHCKALELDEQANIYFNPTC